MKWNWEQSDWPEFCYDSVALEPFERQFLLRSGEFIGACKHVSAADQDRLKIELISDEAVKTSEIEGELLNRDSVQSSLLHQFGLGPDRPRISPAERGIAEMMVDLYRTFASPLSDRMLFRWHRMLLKGSRDVSVIGGYRKRGDPMQVVSGPLHRRRIHFEAPPSNQVSKEMKAFNAWFNESAQRGKKALSSIARAGIAHLYFESIHPFEDGNGRIGRAISEKALAQNLGQPSLIALAQTIERRRKDYYAALERNNKANDITDWLTYFGQVILDAQATSLKRLEFYLAKAKFYERVRGQMNDRQDKAVARMFREGIDGFKGGLSAENYIAITRTSRATATRDLQDLVSRGALTKTGQLKHTRYHLNLPRSGEISR
ncbi:Fic family protein [Reyranella soli]|uniref:Cell division protein Fic n=1 Tax=Reyranella soli TaxID=1230389 RepID=A0A512N259_9HYPH|nr:Fic family protein [Reyranella soli]GEP53060.1 cell division protein Fic [Reyranella soli]